MRIENKFYHILGTIKRGGGGIGLKKENVLFTNTQSNTNLIPLLIFWKEKKREEDYSRIV